MLHYTQMKTTFCHLILCCCLAAVAGFAQGGDSLAQTGKAPALDTIRTTFADGSVARVYTVRAGTVIREGVAISYHPNGKVAVEAPYKNGKLDGVFRSYFESGKIWQTIGYKEDVEEGITTIYFENGKKKKKEIYSQGILNGVAEEYYDDGSLFRSLPYERGLLNGVAKIYDQTGLLKEEMTFDKGLRHGPYRKYNKGLKVFEAKFDRNRCVENCDF